MNDRIFANTGAMASGATRIGQAAQHLEAALKKLDGRILELKEEWKGRDAAAFKTAHDKWAAASKGMHDTLRDISVEVKKSGQRYSDTEAQAASYFPH